MNKRSKIYRAKQMKKQGYSNTEIAKYLGCSEFTVRRYLASDLYKDLV